jgi:hypothetical protein
MDMQKEFNTYIYKMQSLMRSEKTKQMLSNRRKSKEMIESLKIIKGDSNNENVKDDGKRMSRGLSVV